MSDDKEINPYEPPKSDLMVQARRISYAVVVVLVLLSLGMCGFGVSAMEYSYATAPYLLSGAAVVGIGAVVVYWFWFMQEYRRKPPHQGGR